MSGIKEFGKIVVFNIKVFDMLDGWLAGGMKAGRTNTTGYVDPYDAHVNMKIRDIFLIIITFKISSGLKKLLCFCVCLHVYLYMCFCIYECVYYVLFYSIEKVTKLCHFI